MERLRWHVKFANRFDQWFLPESCRDKSLTHWKARLLVSIHIFLLLVVILLQFFSIFFHHSDNEKMPFLGLGILLLITLILIFRKWGNFVVSGNLLALIAIIVLAQSVLQTGGMFSDNLLWMVTAPLLALLFANRTSGFFWLVLIVAFDIYLFILDNQNPGFFWSQIQSLDNLYFLISYSGLFFMVVGIVLVFATGQNMIIRALHEKQMELQRQKTEISNQAKSLKEAEEKLLETNKELEQFAYAASHDLKEPLRMIGTYIQLIQRRLNGHIDENTTEYMNFVTDGVARMDRLLTDLLEYSRLGRSKVTERETNLNEILFVVINNLMASMKETDAAIFSNNLPSIKASSTEMIQLFQNLIANSIKFRQKGVNPEIEISYSIKNNQHWFYLRDNGIGIPAANARSVFNIFERLHSRQEYEGTGIGLATCKKIVNNLGGDIWVEPDDTPGTTFFFTIPFGKTSGNAEINN